MNSEKQNESEAYVTSRSKGYPEDDADRLVKEFLEWLKREKIPAHGWITALSSIALLVVTFGLLVVSCQNYHETSPLVDYARRSTAAAETQRDASLTSYPFAPRALCGHSRFGCAFDPMHFRGMERQQTSR